MKKLRWEKAVVLVGTGIVLQSALITSVSAVSEDLERQWQIFEQHPNVEAAESLLALQKLSELGLVVTPESLEATKMHPGTARLQLDVYQGANLLIFMYHVLDFILNGRDESFAGQRQRIRANPDLESALTALKNACETLSQYEIVNFDDVSYLEQYHQVQNCMADSMQLIQDLGFPANNPMVGFLVEFKEIFDLSFVRYATEKALSEIRAALEGVQAKSFNQSTSIAVNIPMPIPGLTANAEAVAQSESIGSTGLSFYTSKSVKGAKGGFTLKVPLAKISAKSGLEITTTDIFYSLEAFMDGLNARSKFSLFKKSMMPEMKMQAQNRKNMQGKETDALRVIGNLERHLKLFSVLPYGVNLIYIDITKSTSSIKSKETTVFGEVGASMTIPTSEVGITFKATLGRRKYVRDFPRFYFVKDDLTPRDGYSPEEVKM
ncbi:MAG: hypothetical protein LBE95_01300, partial [Holosporaceae bacterium]|nr:hypothetical protein [Holosporaceae bacterium]